MKKVCSILTLLGFVLAAPQSAICGDGYRVITPKDSSKTVSLDLRGTEIQSALKILAETKNANIAFQRDVNGNVRSFHVSGVPASQVFQILLRMHGLYAVEEGNVVIVYPIEQYIRDAEARRALSEE
jgi:type II secretory pathway component HofQ